MKEPELIPFNTLMDGQFEYWANIHHPFTGGIEITTHCNFNCIHCYLKNSHSVADHLSNMQLKAIIDDLYANGVLYLYITGGEILARADFLDIYLYAKRKGFLVTLLTNLSLLTQEIIDVFKKYPPLLISVSLYGATNETYNTVTGVPAFNKVLNNIKELKKANISFEVKYVLMKENLKDLKKAKEIVKSELNTEFNYYYEFFPTFEGDVSTVSHMLSYDEIINLEKKDLRILDYRNKTFKMVNPYKYNKDFKEFFCLSGACRFFIDSKGYVYPCHKLRIKTDNILRTSFKKIWNELFVDLLNQPATENNKCVKCDHLLFCQPCPGENMLYSGNAGIPNKSQCKLTQLRISMLIHQQI